MNPDSAELDRPVPEGLPAPSAPRPTALDTFRARIMFLLAFVYLLLVAGLTHRAMSEGSVTQPELVVIYVGLTALWPVFVAEAWWGVARRDRSRPRRPVVLRAVLVSLMPPWRMALADPRTGLVWIPRMGWREPGKELFKRLELVFSGPMLLFAFLILPVLVLEYVRSEQVKTNPALALGLDIGIAVIWVAFATEYIFKASTHPKPLRFAAERWLDAAIVVLPMLEFVLNKWADAAPIARLLRLGRVLSPEYIARMQQLYRLRGVAMKAWHALLVIEALARLFGQTPAKRLGKLEERIAELEEELAELRRDAAVARTLIAEEAAPPEEDQNQPEVASPGRAGVPSGVVATQSNRPSGP